MSSNLLQQEQESWHTSPFQKQLASSCGRWCQGGKNIWGSLVLVVKNVPASARGIRDVGLIPGPGRFPAGENDHPFQYSCRENPMDRGAWRATVHRIAKSRTWLKQLSKHRCTDLNPQIIECLWKHGEGNGNPLQYSCLKNPMNRGAW